MALARDEFEYLGDGGPRVYIQFDGYGFWLLANDHRNPTDRVYLDETTLAALRRVTDATLAVEADRRSPKPGE